MFFQLWSEGTPHMWSMLFIEPAPAGLGERCSIYNLGFHHESEIHLQLPGSFSHEGGSCLIHRAGPSVQ